MPKTTIEIPLYNGVNTSVDPKVLPVGSNAVLENGRFDKAGVVQKRTGYETFKKPAYQTQASMIANIKDELIGVFGSSLYSYSESRNEWAIRSGNVFPIEVQTHSLISTSRPSYQSDIAITNNFLCQVSQSVNNSLYAALFDLKNSYTLITSSTLTVNANPPRVVASGDYIYVLWTNSSTTTLWCYYIDTSSSSPTFTNLSLGLTSVGGDKQFDAQPLDDDGTIALIYERTSSMRLLKFNSGGKIGSEIVLDQNPESAQLGICCDEGNIYTCYRVGNNVYADGYTSNLVGIFDTKCIAVNSTARDFVGVRKGDNIYWTYNVESSTTLGGSQASIAYAYHSTDGTITSLSSTTFCYGARILSRPFSSPYSSVQLFLIGAYYTAGEVGDVDGYQSSNFIVTSAGTPAVHFNQFEGVEERLVHSYGTIRPSNSVLFENCRYISAPKTNASYYSPLDRTYVCHPTVCRFDMCAKPTAVSFNDSGYIAAADLCEYDKSSVTSAGWYLFPEVTGFTKASTGGYLSDGAYSVICCFEAKDQVGKIRRSAFSVPTTINLTAGTSTQKITLYVPFVSLTKQTAQRLAVYITNPNGEQYYLVSNSTTPTSSVEYRPEITAVDASAPGPYTDGGVAENSMPGNPRGLCAANNRLFVPGADGNLYFSQERTVGSSAEFSTYLQTSMPLRTDGYMSIQENNSRMFIFAKDGICTFFGRGPDSTGANSDYLLDSIATDVGLKYSSGVISTENGIYFPSQRGICLLDPSLKVRHIGAISDYDGYQITSAARVAKHGEIRFTTEEGPILVYNYDFNLWSVFTGIPVWDSCLFKDKHVLLQRDASIFYDTESSFFDGTTTPITLAVETPWVKVGMLDGFLLAKTASLIGEWRSPHTLNVAIYYDYSDVPNETKTYDATSGSIGAKLNISTKIGKKCQAIKFRVWDSNQSGTGESFRLSVIAIEIKARNGLNKKPIGRRF